MLTAIALAIIVGKVISAGIPAPAKLNHGEGAALASSDHPMQPQIPIDRDGPSHATNGAIGQPVQSLACPAREAADFQHDCDHDRLPASVRSSRSPR